MAPVYRPERSTAVTRAYATLPRETRGPRRRSSLEEFRADVPSGSLPPHSDDAWWEHATKSKWVQLDTPEHRALSRATGPAGNFLVPTDVEAQIVSAARAESAIARHAREVPTTSGSTLNLPTSPAHGAASWVAENAATTPSDEVFGEVSLTAPKMTTKVIVSEELAQDARVPSTST